MNELIGYFKQDLRLWLTIIGIAFILGVWAYNRWQQRRSSRVLSRDFTAGQMPSGTGAHGGISEAATLRDSLGAGVAPTQRREPGFGNGNAGDEAGAVPEAPEGNLNSSHPAHPVEIDEQIYVLIILSAESPLSGDRILAHLHSFRHAGRQPILQAAAPPAGSATEAQWVSIEAGSRYETVVVAVQLANRSGPLNEIEYSQCVTALNQTAEQLPAACDAPEMRETIVRARALDARCAPLDAQIGINIVNLDGTWSGQSIDAVARRNGLLLHPDGRYHAGLAEPDSNGLSLFTLQNADALLEARSETLSAAHGDARVEPRAIPQRQPPAFRTDTLANLISSRLTLLLDVPRAPRDARPYARMKELAFAMADELGGIVADDDLRTLTPRMLDAIERDLEPVYDSLEAEGIAAGSTRALALFS